MRKHVALSALVAALVVGSVASAGPIVIASQGTAADAGESVNCTSVLGPSGCAGGSATAVISHPHPAWGGPDHALFEAAFGGAASAWISIRTDTGDNPFVLDNATMLTFSQPFTLDGYHAGFLRVAADDSASVWLNGVLLFAEAAREGNDYYLCSDVPIGCRSDTYVELFLALGAGTHTFEFITAQRNRVAFGLRYYGELRAVPEPGLLALFGSGLFIVGARVRRRG
jgi:hypothetical protein